MNHSYIVTEKATGKAVVELFSKALADKVNTELFRVQTALQYLGELNVKIKQPDAVQH